MDGYVLVRQAALLDLLALARQAGDELRNRETVSPLADAINGSAAQVAADLAVPCPG